MSAALFALGLLLIFGGTFTLYWTLTGGER